ncbi:D-alanyl-D-alanine carboxypeptidase family protein [Aestuariispira ectoiniformans]|uniref:D-alanyl-D-alanine carboxypeptidase family protein n=1 Tax=Aestuariispira ectoiniformans TaxID=2775080 RepID=UPI00223AEFC2|nr:D-alanyl-D-alanine carboxypeptidase family protein [Aestuariispira ectoiniformans]
MPIRLLTRLAITIALVAASIVATAQAATIETKAKQVILLDYDTGAELLNINADERMYPASMTKMMTAYMLFEQLKNGTLSLDDTFPVSKKAWKKGGSKMFVEVGKRVRIEDLLRGIIIQSGNDATIVAAEGLSGSEEAFARDMTAKAHEIGMLHTQFKNASGWPDEEHYTTARDLATLATAIIRNFPEYYHFFSEKSFTYSGITQGNRNPLIQGEFEGADGLKTGHTELSGFGLTASAIRDGRRLVLVANGMGSMKERALEGERLLTWGFREWNRYQLFQAGQKVVDVPVWLGEQASIPAVVHDDLTLTMRRENRDDLKVKVQYNTPLPAPVAKDTAIGKIVIEAPEMEPKTVPIYAAEEATKLGMMGRLSAALNYLVWGEN